MKAAVYEGAEQLIVKDIPDPVCNDGEVILEIEACTLCGADLRTYRHGHKKIQAPRVLGHEFCGKVVETKANNKDIQVGDRMVMYIVMPCNTCRYCLAGRANLCETRETMSYHYDGAFAQYMKVPAKAVAAGNLFKVTSDIPSKHMALSEPLGCVINAHDRMDIGVKSTVAVIGAGPIGIMHGALARLRGAQKVFMLDTVDNRLELAGGFDFDARIRVEKDGSHRDEVAALTDGFGPDIVIVACSNAHAQIDGLEMAGKGARVEFFGGLPKSNPFANLNTNHLHYKEIEISGSFSEKKSDYQAAQAIVQSGRFPADKIVTHVLPLKDIVKGIELVEAGEALKVCIDPRM